MYVGVLTMLLGEAFLFEARVLFEYAGGVFVLFFAFVVFYEEPALRRKFGELYSRYCDLVPRWIPKLRAPGGNEHAGARPDTNGTTHDS